MCLNFGDFKCNPPSYYTLPFLNPIAQVARRKVSNGLTVLGKYFGSLHSYGPAPRQCLEVNREVDDLSLFLLPLAEANDFIVSFLCQHNLGLFQQLKPLSMLVFAHISVYIATDSFLLPLLH